MSTRNIPRQSPNTSSMQTVGQNLFNQLLDVGQKLLQADPELYKTAVAHLRDNAPREPSPVRRAAGAELKGVQGDHARRSSNAFHKYNLPGDAGKREYYQCMICSERRVTNSFHADHQHEGQKLAVRWYCPLCDTLYAVTHRGYHIKNRHKSPGKSGKRTASVKSETASEGENEVDSDSSSPRATKRPRHDEDDNTSQGSEDASANVLANFKPNLTTPNLTTPALSTPNLTTTTIPSPPIPQPSESGAAITHTITQEALLGSNTGQSELLYGMEPSGTISVAAPPEGKMIFNAVRATISRP